MNRNTNINKKYKPYIRRLKPTDKSESMRTCVRMAYYNITGKKAFALVQHGFPDLVIEVGSSKQEIKKSILMGGTFKQWQRRVKDFGKLQN